VRQLSEAEVRKEARLRGGRAPRVADEFAATGKLYLHTFGEGDQEAFLDLAWQEVTRTRYLTPRHSPRTLRATADRVHELFGSFVELVAAAGNPEFDPGWFNVCADIEREGFNWMKFQKPWLAPTAGDERRGSPATCWYIWEGNHSALVLAFMLRHRDLAWRPVDCIVSGERPGD
jgi:hypothetical protein